MKADPRYVFGTREHAEYRLAVARAKYARLEERIGELMAQRADLEGEIADWLREVKGAP